MGKGHPNCGFFPSNKAILLTGNGRLFTDTDAKGIATSVTQLPGIWISPGYLVSNPVSMKIFAGISLVPRSSLSDEILVLDGRSLQPLERIATRKKFVSLGA